MLRYSLRGLLLAVTVIGCGIGVLRGCYIELTHVETAEGVERVDWLPPTASNVSYYKSYMYTAYEFDMSEADFKSWTWHKVKPITTNVQVNRFSYMTRDSSALDLSSPEEQWKRWEEAGTATVTNGLYYSDRRSNGGGVTLAYDRAIGRVFFQTNPR